MLKKRLYSFVVWYCKAMRGSILFAVTFAFAFLLTRQLSQPFAVVLCALFYNARSPAAPNRAKTLSAYSVETATILDRDDTKCLKTRIESSVKFYATVDHGEGHSSVASNFDADSGLHFVEVVLLFDHVKSRQCVKELLTVGAAGGPSVLPVTPEYKLNDNFTTTEVGGTYERDQTVELLKWQGRTYTLSVVDSGITKP